MNDTFVNTGRSAWATARGDARLLAEIALAAAEAGLIEQAKPILALLEQLEPEHPAPAVARAIAALARNQPVEAVETLQRDALGKRQGQDAARGILLVALVAADRRDEARTLADEMLAGPDNSARRMAVMLKPALGPVSPSPGAGVAPTGRWQQPAAPEKPRQAAAGPSSAGLGLARGVY